MKDSQFSSTNANNKRSRVVDSSPSTSILPHTCKKPKHISKSALIHLQLFDVPLVSQGGWLLDSICLQPDRPYTFGRSRTNSDCDFLFSDRRVSKHHCQIFFDSVQRKIYVVDGAVVLHDVRTSRVISYFRRRLSCYDQLEGGQKENFELKASLNGVFVNGSRVERGRVRELCTGDEILLVCGKEELCNLGNRIGFVIQKVVFKEEVIMGINEFQLERLGLCGTANSMEISQGSVSGGNRNKRVFAVRSNEVMSSINDFPRRKSGAVVGRAKLLSTQCRKILHSDDPIYYIQKCASSDFRMDSPDACNSKLDNHVGLPPRDTNKVLLGQELEVQTDSFLSQKGTRPCNNSHIDQVISNSKGHQNDNSGALSKSDIVDNCKDLSVHSKDKQNASHLCEVPVKNCPPPGKKFYLNRLHFMDHNSSSHQNVISLPELLNPIGSIVRIFIATFTSDILWFLSCCEIPSHLPVTIACHNTEKCWSSSPHKRISIPYSGFPNLVVVFPPFPEAIAFGGNDRKRQGIACHHPKLFVLQRQDSIRVIITSANLVANQWNNVTNTVWWQDFPTRSAPDVSSLFIQVSDREVNQDPRSDFAAQLAGFIASLVVDVPSQAHWIIELAKYNFEGALGYLVASVPGIYSRRVPYAYESMLESVDVNCLGSVETSVVGLSHLFRSAADTNGALLKRLAVFLGKSRENAYQTSEIVLRRNTNVPADVNAVNVLVSNPDQFSEDCVQLGFLPRGVAKWVSPLWDSGFFRFYGYIHPKEALAAALGGSNKRVELILLVSQGPCFADMMRMMLTEHVVALSSLIASIQRCIGLWRLQEVLDQYKWPQLEKSDFLYGASSIGSSVNAQFLASFSAATGQRSLQLFDSEESDPEWGCWTASHELQNPSIKIIFPTIERVQNACNGILPSRRILCFSEKTWQRLRSADILHDAVPYPYDRVGHPMHVKVAQKRFQSKADAHSVGWVYCGSHNFSAAAWGRSISNPFGPKSDEPRKPKSSLGLKLHVCNYELGIVFVFPPSGAKGIGNKEANLDDVVLPFAVPAPKYGQTHKPATKRAMRDALTEYVEPERENLVESTNLEEMTEEIPDEEDEVVEAIDYAEEEKEEEQAYAEMLWCQVESSQSC